MRKRHGFLYDTGMIFLVEYAFPKKKYSIKGVYKVDIIVFLKTLTHFLDKSVILFVKFIFTLS